MTVPAETIPPKIDTLSGSLPAGGAPPSVLGSGEAPKGLNRRVAKGGAIALSAQGGKTLIRVAALAVLGRFLSPADFGLVGLVTVVTGFVETFKDAGLSMATVQRRDVTQAQLSTLFWVNVVVAIALMLAQVALAPLLAWFYQEPRLLAVTVALAVVTGISGVAIQPQAILRRNLQFGRLALIEVASVAIGAISAIGLAVAGFGYWSVVGMAAGTSLGAILLTLGLARWRPDRPGWAPGASEMVRFGGNFAGAGVLNYITRNADNFIAGLIHGPAALGLYGRAYALFFLPLQQFLAPISSVVVPALARVTADPARFRSIVLEKSYLIVFAVTAAMGFVFVAAPELIRLLLGPGWEKAAEVTRWLTIGGIVYSTNIAGSWISAPHGWAHRQLKLAAVVAPLYVAAYLVGSRYGIVGIAGAFSITCVLLRYPAFAYLCRGSPIRPGDLILPLLRVTAVVTLAVALTLAGIVPLSLEWPMALATKAVVYITLFAVLCLARAARIPQLTRVD